MNISLLFYTFSKDPRWNIVFQTIRINILLRLLTFTKHAKPLLQFYHITFISTFQIFTTFAPNLDKTFCSLDCVPCTSASCKVGCSAENCFWGRGSWQRHMVVLLVKRWQRAMSDTMGVCRALQLKHKTVDTSPPPRPLPRAMWIKATRQEKSGLLREMTLRKTHFPAIGC